MLRKFMLSLCVSVFAMGVAVDHAEAKRLGGGKSFGMKRQATPQRQATPPAAAPQQNAAARPGAPAGAAAPATGWRKWAGPLTGLAAGIGLAAMLSHFGIGGEFAGIILAVLAIALVVFLIRRYMARGNANQPAYAGAGANYRQQTDNERPMHFQPAAAGNDGAGGNEAPVSEGNIPADFDVPAFLRQAKLGFVRLQAANDTADLADIRDFTSPEVFAEIKLAIDERGAVEQKTDVIVLEAEVLEVAEENARYVVSVHFHGQLREERDAAPTAFAEVWHLTKPMDGSRGWMLAGIQQIS